MFRLDDLFKTWLCKRFCVENFPALPVYRTATILISSPTSCACFDDAYDLMLMKGL